MVKRSKYLAPLMKNNHTRYQSSMELKRRFDRILRGFLSLAQPPVFAYNDILEKQFDQEKEIRKGGRWNNPWTMHLGDVGVERDLLGEYEGWIVGMREAAKKEGRAEVGSVYSRLREDVGLDVNDMALESMWYARLLQIVEAVAVSVPDEDEEDEGGTCDGKMLCGIADGNENESIEYMPASKRTSYVHDRGV